MSRQVYEESCARGWPGLGEEVTQICREINIPDVNNVWVTKEEIKNAVRNHHYQDMKKELSDSKKLMDIKEEDFSEVQDYFKEKSIWNTRMAFKVWTKILTEIPAHVKNKFKRVGSDLTNSMDMVTFFRKLSDERTRLEKEEVMGKGSHDSCSDDSAP